MLILLKSKEAFLLSLADTARFVETPPRVIISVTSSPLNLTWIFSFSGVVPTIMVTKDQDIQIDVLKNTHGTSGIVVVMINEKSLKSVDKITILLTLTQRLKISTRSAVILYISTGIISQH